MATLVVVAHGLSEMIFCEHVAHSMKVDICMFSRAEGRECIQIRDLRDMMSEHPFDSYRSLSKRFPDLEYCPERTRFSEDKSPMPRLTICPVMDTDDSPLDERSYMTGELFRDSPFKKHIVPVFNIRNLDEVLERYGAIDRNNKARSYRDLLYSLDYRDLLAFLKQDPGTNLDVFIESCMARSPSMQGKMAS